ncbi:metal-dependent hydrolase [Candidatus Latescibacterota bacterium]
MDSVSQAALGGVIGHTVLGHRVGRKAAAWGAVCGTLPDLDVFIPLGNDVLNVTMHRAASHSLLVLCLAAPAVAWGITRIHRDTWQYWRGWMLLALLSLVTHPLLDAFTVYGTQLLWPLRAPPVTWSTVFIIDPLYTMPLLAGLIAGLVWHRGSGLGSRGWRWGLWGLGLSCAYLAFALGAKLHVESAARRDLAAQGISAEQLLTVAAPFNTLLWRIVAVDDEAYYEGYRSLLDGGETPTPFTRYPRNPELLQDLSDHWAVQRLQWFSKGYWAAGERDDTVYLVDLRMGFEPRYVFAFAVGERTPAGVIAADGRRLQLFEFDPGQVAWVWRRIWDVGAGIRPPS